MRIAVDTDPVGRNRSGNETYLVGMVRGLQEQLTLDDQLVLVGGDAAAVGALAQPGTRLVPAPGGMRGELTAGRRMARAQADWALASYNAPLGFGGRVATIVHDVSYLRQPQTYPTLLRRRIAWSVARSVRRSALIVTCSAFSRDELLDCYPLLRADAVVVTGAAADARFSAAPSDEALAALRTRQALPETFVLAVGNLQPRKNLHRLAQAARAAGLPLVVVGQPAWKSGEVVAALTGDGVRWLGRVSDDELVALYATCAVFAYPSLYEGFGLPVVEAMAAGAPVVTSATTSLAEVAADAAVTVDPTSVDEIAVALAKVAGDAALADDLRARGRRRAADFSWSASARALLDALGSASP